LVEKWPEAEHVRPCGQPQVLELGELAEPKTRGDVAAGMVADGQVGEPIGRGDAAVQGAGAFGGLGCVLGQVPGDLGVGYVAVGADGPGVELTAPCERAGEAPRSGRSRDADGAGGLVDGGGERARVAQAGGAAAGPAGPSSRMIAWKWTTPRRWYSATLA
jgi:hypothetical protein